MAAILPLLVILGALQWRGEQSRPLALQESPAPTRKVRVTAQRFHFSPSTIRVKLGTRLRIILRSRDTFHGFRIVGTKINILIPARGRGQAEAVFLARKKGRFEFECSKKCGAGHSQMRGQIVVQ